MAKKAEGAKEAPKKTEGAKKGSKKEEVRAQRLYAGSPRGKEEPTDATMINASELLKMQANLQAQMDQLNAMLKVLGMQQPATVGSVTNTLENMPIAQDLNTTAEFSAAKDALAENEKKIKGAFTPAGLKEAENIMDSSKQDERISKLATSKRKSRNVKSDEQKAADQKKSDEAYIDRKEKKFTAEKAMSDVRSRYGVVLPKARFGNQIILRYEPSSSDYTDGDITVHVVRTGLKIVDDGPEFDAEGKRTGHRLNEREEQGELSDTTVTVPFYEVSNFMSDMERYASATGNKVQRQTVFNGDNISADEFDRIADLFEAGKNLRTTEFVEGYKATAQKNAEAKAARIEELKERGEWDYENNRPINNFGKEEEDTKPNRYRKTYASTLTPEAIAAREKVAEITREVNKQRDEQLAKAREAWDDHVSKLFTNDFGDNYIDMSESLFNSWIPSPDVSTGTAAETQRSLMFNALMAQQQLKQRIANNKIANDMAKASFADYYSPESKKNYDILLRAKNDLESKYKTEELLDTKSNVGLQYIDLLHKLSDAQDKAYYIAPEHVRKLYDAKKKSISDDTAGLERVTRMVEGAPDLRKAREASAKKVISDALENGFSMPQAIINQFENLPDRKSKLAYIGQIRNAAKVSKKDDRDFLNTVATVLNAQTFLQHMPEEHEVSYTDETGKKHTTSYIDSFKEYQYMSPNELLFELKDLKRQLRRTHPALQGNLKEKIARVEDMIYINSFHPRSKLHGLNGGYWDEERQKWVFQLNKEDVVDRMIKEAGLEKVKSSYKKGSDAYLMAHGIAPTAENRLKMAQADADAAQARVAAAKEAEAKKFEADLTDEQKEHYASQVGAIVEANKAEEKAEAREAAIKRKEYAIAHPEHALNRTADHMRAQGVSDDVVDAYVNSKGDKSAKMDAMYLDEAYKIMGDRNYAGNKKLRDLYSSAINYAVKQGSGIYNKEDVMQSYPIESFAKSIIAGRTKTAWEDALQATAAKRKDSKEAKRNKKQKQKAITAAVMDTPPGYEYNDMDTVVPDDESDRLLDTDDINTAMYGEENNDVLDEGDEV